MSHNKQLNQFKLSCNIFSDSNSSNVDIDKFLEDEKIFNKNSTWNKLNKLDKTQKLYKFSEQYGKENNLTMREIKELKQYLKQNLDRKKLQNLKEVSYDKESGNIKKITYLQFNKNTKKFTLRVPEKKSAKSKSTTSLKSVKSPSKSQTKPNKTTKIRKKKGDTTATT